MSADASDLKQIKQEGHAHYKKKEWEKSVQLFEKALELAPDDADAWFGMGQALHAKGDLERAVSAYKKVTVLDPHDGDGYNLLGVCYYEKGNLEQSMASYREAIKKAPDSAAFLNNLGVALFESGQMEEAVETYRRALENHSSDTMVLSNLGVALTHLGKHAEARSAFEKTLALDPNEVIAHYCMGIDYEHKGQVKIGSVVRIGTLLKVRPGAQLSTRSYERIYKARVEDLSEDTMTISAPTEAGVVVPLRPGMFLIVGVGQDDALYGFYTEIIERKRGDIPQLVIRRVEKTKRIQRRRYVRIDGSVDISMKVFKKVSSTSSHEVGDPKIIQEKNLSAGGMMLMSDIPLPRGTVVQLDLKLPDGRLVTAGEVVRTLRHEESHGFELGIRFVNLKEKERDRLVRYVNSRMVELRKKGLDKI